MGLSFAQSVQQNSTEQTANTVAVASVDSEVMVAAEEVVWTQDEKYAYYPEYSDSNVSTVDTDKNIVVNNKQINITQETNSQFIPFLMDRYYDGVDLSSKTIVISFKNREGNIDFAAPINVSYSNDKIKFAWLVDARVTAVEGEIQFEIQAVGVNSKGDEYVWRTKPNGKLNVLKALSGNGVIEPDSTWMAGFLNQMSEFLSGALAAAQAAQGEVDALETLVGSLPEGTSATSVVDYVNVKTAGIATDAALAELQGQVSGAQEAIDAIEADYLKGSDKTEVLEAVAAEETRAKGVEGGLETRLKAVEDDYLKGADKTELQTTINDNKAILDAVKEDVDAFFADADFSEAAKDTLKEIQTYIDSDVEGAAAMAESIQKNKTDIEGVSGRVTTLEGDMTQAKTDIDNAEAKIAELESAIGEGGNVAEQIAAAVKVEEDARKAADTTLQGNIDAVAGRVTTLEGEMDAVEGAVATKAEQADLTAAVGRITTAEGKVSTLEGKMTTAEGEIDTLQSEMDAVEAKAAANETAIGTLNTTVAGKANQSALEAEIARAQAAEKVNADAIAAFVEISESEINSLFAQA